MGIKDEIPQQSMHTRIVGLRQESYGLVVTAENGPAKLEFIGSGSWIKDQLHIGQIVRATITISES
jgi:hypothetical protein